MNSPVCMRAIDYHSFLTAFLAINLTPKRDKTTATCTKSRCTPVKPARVTRHACEAHASMHSIGDLHTRQQALAHLLEYLLSLLLQTSAGSGSTYHVKETVPLPFPLFSLSHKLLYMRISEQRWRDHSSSTF